VTLDHQIFTRWPAQYPDRLQLLQFRNGLVAGYCGIIDSLKAVQQLTD